MTMKTALPLLFSLLPCAAGAVEAHNQTLRLEGRYEYRTDEESLEVLGRQVCFVPSASSAKLLPRRPSDRRLAWFCFTDSEQAARAFGFPLAALAGACGVTGTASIDVSAFQVFHDEGDGNDVATLVHVHSKSVPARLPCPQ
jgi:hypothetical protein